MKDQSTFTSSAHTFGDLPVNDHIATALDAMGYVQPTPIQDQAIPLLREGHDLIGLARTGSGKTAGFGIPIIESIRTSDRKVQALVLVPTRELAAQVAVELGKLGAPSGVRVVAVYGGVGMVPQIHALRGNAHVVVGTPGRVFDHLGRGTLNVSSVRFAVLDEADRMLDVGFAPAIDAILSRIPGPRQTALFSATFPHEVEAMAARQTREPKRVTVDAPGAALETLEERFVRVPSDGDKMLALQQLLGGESCTLALIFRRTTHRADKLARDLERRGFSVATLHGRRTQAQREKALGALRSGQLQALVATDIAARGLDITGLTHVVNYDLPDTAENYTHRVGRTARMGADGIAVTLVSPEDEDALRAIQRKLPNAAARTGQAAPVAAQGTHRQSRGGGRQVHASRPAASTPTQRPAQAPIARQERPVAERPAAAATQPPSSTTHNRPGGFQRRPAGRPSGFQPRPRDSQPVVATTNEDGWYPFRSGQRVAR